ncbi:DnaJ domain [Macleaya cordata]|uniref:DnaJ domain n=1 Tax=Macleaya cordata TaxID=56857 RepID=A0A200PRP3_MACCD|nr:DnaJ domain [Macleaya cordata]
MQAYLLPLASTSSVNLLLGQSVRCFQKFRLNRCRRGLSGAAVTVAAINRKEQDHYAVLGLSSTASSTDIKRNPVSGNIELFAYFPYPYPYWCIIYHPDVCKDSQSGEVFKSIRLAYDVLSDEEKRTKYDYALKFQDDSRNSWRRKSTYYNAEFDEEAIRVYRWAELRRQMRREKYWQQYEATEENSFSFDETDTDEEEEEETSSDKRRGSFSHVLSLAFFTLFFMQTFGSQVSLLLCSFTALLDKKLDAGYKLGYLIAWILGGRDGILLTLCLSFASWLCGKTSSNLVAVVVVAMWVGTSLARYAPLPQGAILTLLYMSVKLQGDLS